jgi:protein phosphatase
MDTLARLCAFETGLLLQTPYKLVDVTNPESETEAIQWWNELTGRGGEGMVVKPADFITK